MPNFDKEAQETFEELWGVLEKSSKAQSAGQIIGGTLRIHEIIKKALSKAYDKGYSDAFNQRFADQSKS